MEVLLKYVIEFLFEFIKEVISYITLDKLLVLIFIVIVFFYFKENKKIKLLKLLEIGSNIFIASCLGYLVKVGNIEGLLKILNLFWSLIIGLIIFFFLLFLRELVIYFKSPKKIFVGYSTGYVFLGLIFMFTAVALDQFNPLYIFLFIICFLGLWMIIQLINQSNKNTDFHSDEESDNPINTYSQLLPTRKSDFNRVYNQLTNVRYNEPFAITINGDWGSGKTSFVNVLSKKLEENDNHIIFIQPMILDTNEKQMDYLFKQLKVILNNNGIYTGKGSPFKQYFKLITTILNARPLMQLEGLFSIMEDDEVSGDFRTNKLLLEEELQQLLKTKKGKLIGKKIYIIVDDFDRVEKETMYHTLVFIKELVHFKGVNVIFLMDEQKLEVIKDNKINKDYLDKFVNTKIQISKIDSDEIFSYFLDKIKEEEFKSEYIKKVLKDLKDNMNDHIDQLQMMMEKRIAEVENTIADYIKLKGDDNNEYKQNKRYEELDSKRKQLFYSLNRFKSELTNIRKAKKVVREIREILTELDLQHGKIGFSNFVDNMKKIKIDEKIINISILKILFSESVDEIIKGSDTREFIYETDEDFLKFLFEELGNTSYTEDKELIANLANLFCNSILLRKDFSIELFSESRTYTERKLNNLDKVEVLDISSNHFEEIQEYLKVIKYNDWNVPKKTTLKRLEKLIEYIFILYDEEKISLEQLFKLLLKPQRNVLIDQGLYFEKLNNILQQDKKFVSEKDKNASLYYLEQIDIPLFFNYKNKIIMFISLLKIKEGSFTYENFLADLGGILKLDEMIKEIKEIFKENDGDLFDIDFLAAWVERSMDRIKVDFADNEYIIDSVEKQKKSIDKFVEIYRLLSEVKFRVKNLSVNNNSKFQNSVEVKSIKELEFDIFEFYEYINMGNKVGPHLYYFNSILIYLNKYTRGNKIKKETIKAVDGIYQKIKGEDLNEITTDEEDLLLACTINLGEIKENLKVER